MRIYKEVELQDFEFWGGAISTIDELTEEQVQTIWEGLEETAAEPMTETDINDFFWFDTDTIAAWLGFADWEDFLQSKEE